MKLIIDRKVWIHGEGDGSSMLYRPADGKMCCVGIYLHALGMTYEALSHMPVASDVANGGCPLPDEANWLINLPVTPADRESTSDASALYETNDKWYKITQFSDQVPFSESEREAEIAKIFAKHGVEVEFIN